MIISPPLLPVEGLVTPSEKWKSDPMMDAIDGFELSHHGLFPIAFDRRWHCGVHLVPYGGLGQGEPVWAIADGEVVVYRVSKTAISDGQKNSDGSLALNSNNGFVLLKHSTDTGEGRTITFYSLYMHLMDIASANAFAGYPNHPPPDSSPDCLPLWLLRDTAGVVSGEGKKVHRKDQLGFVGQCHGYRHLHFEVFMTEEDFSAYFQQASHPISLGSLPSITPRSADYWGHSYFVIPGGATFSSVPPRVGQLVTKGARPKSFFPPLQADVLDANSTLYVETYFNRGERFTRSWIDRGDRKLTLLTPRPVQDKYAEYEYDLYERATALYPTCPSEGYELLRFGRILSTNQPKLSTAEATTWVSIPFDVDRMGYIDINQSRIIKLSDANFPAFMDWKKIEPGHTPFDQNGLCGYDALCKITGIEDRWLRFALNAEEMSHDERLTRYVRDHDDARAKLKGFVCHSRSEGDASWNRERFKDLTEPDGFFGKRKEIDPHGFDDFLNFVEQFQFMKQTRFGEGKKFWFFHPLAFIRHFRKCGWLSIGEFSRIYSDEHYQRNAPVPPTELRTLYLTPLNYATRKYSISSPLRLAHFLGQGAVESNWLASMQETSMMGPLHASALRGERINPASTKSERVLGHWYGQLSEEDDPWFRSEKFNSSGRRISGSYDWRNGNCDREDAQKFRGRGFKQLTGRSNYADYWIFRGWITQTSFDESWWNDPAYAEHKRREMVKKPADIVDPESVCKAENCIDSGAFYLRCKRKKVAAKIDADRPRVATSATEKTSEREISRAVTYAINGGYIDDVNRLEFTRLAKEIVCD